MFDDAIRQRTALRMRTLLHATAVLLLVGAASALSELELLDVAPLAVPCAPDAAERACLMVRASDGEPWRVSEGVITGFEPRAGHGYRLAVGVDAGGGRELLAVLEEVPLGDLRWRVETVEVGAERIDVAGSADAWLRLDASGERVHGSGGCNAFFGAAQPIGHGQTALGPLAGTLMACPEPLMVVERALTTLLAGLVTFDQDGAWLRLRSPSGSAWLRPELPREATATVRRWGEPGLAAFDATVAAASARGEPWPADPLLVALALAEPWDAAVLDVARRDADPEGARVSVVSVEARGFLDDSVAGFRRVAVLERRDDGRWRVVAETDAVRCARGDTLWIPASELCP